MTNREEVKCDLLFGVVRRWIRTQFVQFLTVLKLKTCQPRKNDTWENEWCAELVICVATLVGYWVLRNVFLILFFPIPKSIQYASRKRGRNQGLFAKSTCFR